jgi:hypothetical protein
MFHSVLRLRRHVELAPELPSKLLPKRTVRPEKLLHIGTALLGCTFDFDATVTLTTAGVTRAANVSIARSRVSSAPTLLSSSGDAAGAAVAAFADFVNSSVATEPTAATASTAANTRRVTTVLHRCIHICFLLEVCFDLSATKYLVVKHKKFLS